MHAVQVASALGKSEFSCDFGSCGGVAGRRIRSTACVILQYADSYIYTVVRPEYYSIICMDPIGSAAGACK